ncbi:hypothetical protein AAFF_G00167100 [Aldrovandia affinis]|uniref:Uncharacterized protein n=1 Tax=Aldrovandia affinis TaxID=143900 RepID=A0AAD7RLZ8_9TELE|nr:hypothetical protein AAFF_G00167100 [Aldrovandia affinis]
MREADRGEREPFPPSLQVMRKPFPPSPPELMKALTVPRGPLPPRPSLSGPLTRPFPPLHATAGLAGPLDERWRVPVSAVSLAGLPGHGEAPLPPHTHTPLPPRSSTSCYDAEEDARSRSC